MKKLGSRVMKQEELDKLCELEKALQEAKKGARAGNGRRPSNTARQFAVSPDGAIQRKRGRPRKVRPKRDDWKAFVEEIRMTGRRPSLRDIASVMGWSRQRVSQMLDAAGNITREEF